MLERALALGASHARRRVPLWPLVLPFAMIAALALGAAALLHDRMAQTAFAQLEAQAVLFYRGLALAAPPTLATQEFQVAAQQALSGTRIVGIGVYHAGLAPLARAGTVPDTLSPSEAQVSPGRTLRRREGADLVVVFAAPQEAAAPLLVLVRMDAQSATAALATDAWLLYGGALLLAVFGAAAGLGALWRGYVEPVGSLARLAAHADRRAVDPTLLARHDALGVIARAIEAAQRGCAEIEIARAEGEARIEATLRQRARQLYDAKDRAEAANRAKSAFLASMSHELRTPLNVIIGFSGMMHQQMLGPIGVGKYLEYVADINRSATHLLSIVNDILDLSRIESNAFDLREETFELGPLTTECAAMLKDRIHAKRIDLSANVAPNLPPIRADRRRIKQILINLLSNAEKFTEPGGRIGLLTTRKPDGSIEFVVSDTGIGMTEPEIEIALRPFGQVDSRLARKYEGTGLGLPLSKAMAEMHQGRLSIESAPGRGTSVTVMLPATRAVANAAAVHA